MIQLVTPFPFLLDFAFFAPLLFRFAIAYILFLGISNSVAPLWHKGLFVLIGLSIFVGFGLQIGALVLSLLLIASLVSTKAALPFGATKKETVLLLIISLSLLLSGAGPFAFDLPF
jgi:hypothetical protein